MEKEEGEKEGEEEGEDKEEELELELELEMDEGTEADVDVVGDVELDAVLRGDDVTGPANKTIGESALNVSEQSTAPPGLL